MLLSHCAHHPSCNISSPVLLHCLSNNKWPPYALWIDFSFSGSFNLEFASQFDAWRLLCLTVACFISLSFSQFHVSSTLRLRLGSCYHQTTLRSTETTCTVCGWSSPNPRAASTWPSTTWAWRNSLTSCLLKTAARQNHQFWAPFLEMCCHHPSLPAAMWPDWSFWLITRTQNVASTSLSPVRFKDS